MMRHHTGQRTDRTDPRKSLLVQPARPLGTRWALLRRHRPADAHRMALPLVHLRLTPGRRRLPHVACREREDTLAGGRRGEP